MNMKELTLLNFSEVYSDEETCVKPAQDLRPCHGREQLSRSSFRQEKERSQSRGTHKDGSHRRFESVHRDTQDKTGNGR